jgi:hypothetical protein
MQKTNIKVVVSLGTGVAPVVSTPALDIHIIPDTLSDVSSVLASPVNVIDLCINLVCFIFDFTQIQFKILYDCNTYIGRDTGVSTCLSKDPQC